MTFLSPIIFVALIGVVAYLTQLNNDKVRVVSVLDETGLVKTIFKNSEHTTYNVLENMSLKDAMDLTKETESYGLLHVGKAEGDKALPERITFYSEESPSINTISDFETQIEAKLTNMKLLQNGVDVDMINASKIKIEITQESFDGQKTSKIDSVIKIAFGGALGYLLFMFIIIYGNMIMRSVIEEKTSRIIEVIISSVKPVQLMLGKIFGTSLAGITQFLIWTILGFALILIVSLIFGIDLAQVRTPQQHMIMQAMENPDLNMRVQDVLTAFYNLPLFNLVLAFIFFFIGGYLLYSSLYAAIGAAVDNETDTQQFMMPIIMPLVLSVYIGIFTVVEDPHGTISTIFSFIPLTSPVVMLMRIPFGVPIWQQVLSFAILIGTFMFAVWFAAKIYRVGILMYGKKPSYKELVKWIKY
jgi:ABC-2 type transport system permease protein